MEGSSREGLVWLTQNAQRAPQGVRPDPAPRPPSPEASSSAPPLSLPCGGAAWPSAPPVTAALPPSRRRCRDQPLGAGLIQPLHRAPARDHGLLRGGAALGESRRRRGPRPELLGPRGTSRISTPVRRPPGPARDCDPRPLGPRLPSPSRLPRRPGAWGGRGASAEPGRGRTPARGARGAVPASGRWGSS